MSKEKFLKTNHYFYLLDSRGHQHVIAPSASDSSGDTSDSDTTDMSWQTSFTLYMYVVIG